MNFFCFAPNFVNLCEEEFKTFLAQNSQDIKSEFLMPAVADMFIKKGRGAIEVIGTDAKWFGVTYKEDAPVVKANVDALANSGEYPQNLWA